MTFLSLLTPGDVEENPVHDTTYNIRIVALAAGRHPSDLLADHNAEVDFIGADDGARGRERGFHSVAVRRMNMRRKVVERHGSAERHAPKIESSLVHRELIGVYVPRPQCHPRSSNSQA